MNPKKIIPVVILIVAAAVVLKTRSDKNFYYAGTVEATEVDIPARVSSVISSFPAKEGASVKKAETLAVLACEDIKIDAGNAESEYQRSLTLKFNGSIGVESFEKAKYRRDNAALKASWCNIASPINGTVLDTYYEPGEMVSPGARLLTVADLGEVWAYIYLPQPMIAKIALNMPVKAVIPEIPGKTIEGKITHINDEAEFTPKNVQTRRERTRLVYGVKLTFENTGNILKPGMTIEAGLPE